MDRKKIERDALLRERDFISVLHWEAENNKKGGIYNKIAVEFTYNSNRIEGSRLTLEETYRLFDIRQLGAHDDKVFFSDDIVETLAHFRIIRNIILSHSSPLTKELIRDMHRTLKELTSDAMKPWFRTGDWKALGNTVGGIETSTPEDVDDEIGDLLDWYENLAAKSLDDILSFHVAFERIHPFQDGNGRIGRLIMLRECLRNDIVPFVIENENRAFYYRGLREWDREKAYLRDTCLFEQDMMKSRLDYFTVSY